MSLVKAVEQMEQEIATLKQERDTAYETAMRHRRERDELAAMVAVKDAALESFCGMFDFTGAAEKRRRNALSITGPAAVHEIRAQVLDDAIDEFYGYKNRTADEISVDTAVVLLEDMAAALRLAISDGADAASDCAEAIRNNTGELK